MQEFVHHRRKLSSHGGSFALLSPDDGTERAVIFVHGFLGDPDATWVNFQRLIDHAAAKAEWWQRADCFFFKYRSVKDLTSTSVTGLRKFLKEFFPSPPFSLFSPAAHMVISSEKNKPAIAEQPRIYKELFLVGHSAGCVVIR